MADKVMLHIILGILKTIGILLAVLLALVLLVILTTLFVPVRYRARIVKTDSEMGAQARVTWLLHLVSVFVSYDIGKKEQKFEIRLFGVPLESILGAVKKLTTRKKKAAKKEKPAKQEELKQIEERAEQIIDLAEDTLEDLVEDELENSEEEQNDLADDGLSALISDSEEEQNRSEDILQDVSEEKFIEFEQGADQDYNSEQTQDTETENPPFYEKILYKLTSICDKIIKIPEKTAQVLKKIWNLIQKIVSVVKGLFSSAEHFIEKVMQIPDKIAAFQLMLEHYEVKEVAGDVIRELKYILRHYGPRKAEGFLHFGTGDPATVGQLTGVLYMILPAQAGTLEIQPEFTEAVFETDLTIRGHVRAVHLIPVAWRLLRNKKLMRLIRKIRKLRS